MASKKTQEQTNTPSWSTPPPTQATTNLQNMVNQGVDYATPIRNSYARAEAENDRSYNNPLGAFTTPDVRDKSKRAQSATFHQNLGMDLADAAQQNAQGTFNRQATVAGLTAPTMYNARTVNTTSDPWGTGMQVASLGTSGLLGGLTASKK